MATQNRRGYGNPRGSADLGSGVRTTAGGSYRNPRKGIEDYTAWGKMNVRAPQVAEEEEKELLKGFETAFELGGNDFLKDVDGNTWSLQQNPVINNNWQNGELAQLQKQFESADEKGKKRIQSHIAGYNAAIGGGENSSFSKYLKYVGDPDTYDANVSNTFLPGIDGKNTTMSIAQFSKLNSENPNAVKIASRPNKYNVMQYGFEVNGQFINASAMSDQWLSDNFNVKADLVSDTQASMAKGGIAASFKDVDITSFKSNTEKTFTLANGQQVRTTKNLNEYIHDDWYTKADTFADTYAFNRYSSNNDAIYESAWGQLTEKYKNGKFAPSVELMKKFDVNSASELANKQLNDDQKLELLRDEASESFKVLNGHNGYVMNDGQEMIEDEDGNKWSQVGRALSKNEIQYRKDTITKEADDETSSAGSAAVNIFDAIKSFVGEGSMAGAHENIGTFKKQEIDLPQAVDYLNRSNKKGYSFFSLYDQDAVEDILAKDKLKSKDRKMIDDIIRQKTPGQKSNRLIAYMDNNDDLQVTNFDGTIGSFVSNVALYGPYNDKQRLQVQNSVDEMLAQKRDIPKYTETGANNTDQDVPAPPFTK